MQTLSNLFHTFQKRVEKPVFVYRTGIRRFCYSYAWLFEQSLKMALWLESQGIEKGDRVVIWAPNSPWWGVAFWGCVARGVIIVPVDFMSGKERAEKIIELTEAKLVLQSQYKIDRIRTHSPRFGEAGESGTEDSSSRHSSESWNPEIKNQNKKIGLVENLEYLLESIEPTKAINESKPDDIAELIYTSGTTGDPKGVILTHKNLISNLLQINEHVPVVRASWNFLSVLPLSHTFEQMAGFLTPLYKGASIVYVRTLKPSAIMEAFEQEDIYVVPIVPRLLQALKLSIERELEAKHLGVVFKYLLSRVGAQHIVPLKKRKKWFFPIHRKFGRHFQFFISGGAALSRETAEFWMNMGFRVIEGYGITECSPVLTANTFEEQIIGSVGKPLPGVEIRIAIIGHPEPVEGSRRLAPFAALDSSHSLRMTETAGEILAKGPNVFPGYYHNEEATRKAFVKLDSDSNEEDGLARRSAGVGRWFKTGDNGYFDEQGNLYIKGRQKEMIVTGAGINVYPDDIEPMLNSIPGVKEACVIGKQTGEGEEVHAVLILDDSGRGVLQYAPTGRDDNQVAKSIIDQANARLDTLQQITGFTIWPEKEFPKTSTLKIQKFKVKQAVESVETKHASSLQQTDKLISIVATVTGKPSSEISESSVLVSDLGLTSIARLELVNTLEQEFRLDTEDTAITQTTTVADVRKMIEKREKHHGKHGSRMWIHSSFGRAVQYFMDTLLNWHVFRSFVKLRVEGSEYLKNLQQPVVFIANHVSFIDGPCVFASLPARWRYRLAAASREDLFFTKDQNILQRIIGRLYFEFMTLLSGVILLSQTGGSFRQSLSFMGKLCDRGVSILFFPEGERSWDGKLLPFQSGLGIIVKELKVPVVPLKIIGAEKLLPRGSGRLKRGAVTVRYGEPLVFKNEQPSGIVTRCRQTIEAL